jgi:hypothetical protein
MTRSRSLAALALWLCLSAYPAHPTSQGAPTKATPVPPNIRTNNLRLGDCEARIRHWETWYAEDQPAQGRLLADYNKVTEQNLLLETRLNLLRSERNKTIIISLALGAGVFASSILWRILRALRPLALVVKQLIVLILGAAWISVAALLTAVDPKLSVRPAILALAVGMYSLPAVLFSGIAMWWFAKEKSEAESHAPS